MYGKIVGIGLVLAFFLCTPPKYEYSERQAGLQEFITYYEDENCKVEK